MTLAKLKIIPRQPSNLEEFEVLFNPSSYSISKSVTWKSLGDSASSSTTETNLEFNATLLNFGGGNSRVLTLKLFFDVTEPVNGQRIRDVRVGPDGAVYVLTDSGTPSVSPNTPPTSRLLKLTPSDVCALF